MRVACCRRSPGLSNGTYNFRRGQTCEPLELPRHMPLFTALTCSSPKLSIPARVPHNLVSVPPYIWETLGLDCLEMLDYLVHVRGLLTASVPGNPLAQCRVDSVVLSTTRVSTARTAWSSRRGDIQLSACVYTRDGGDHLWKARG